MRRPNVRQPEADMSPEEKFRNGRCEYSVRGVYCTLPGVSGPATPMSGSGGRPDGGPWHCWLHETNRPQSDSALADLVAVNTDRDRLIRDYYGSAPIDEKIQARLAEHPEWYRQPDESSSAYADRMLELHKKMGAP